MDAYYELGELKKELVEHYEKLGLLLDDESNLTFNTLIHEINYVIERIHICDDMEFFWELPDRIRGIKSNLIKEADKLNEHGDVIKVIADKLGIWADNIKPTARGVMIK